MLIFLNINLDIVKIMSYTCTPARRYAKHVRINNAAFLKGTLKSIYINQSRVTYTIYNLRTDLNDLIFVGFVSVEKSR